MTEYIYFIIFNVCCVLGIYCINLRATNQKLKRQLSKASNDAKYAWELYLRERHITTQRFHSQMPVQKGPRLYVVKSEEESHGA